MAETGRGPPCKTWRKPWGSIAQAKEESWRYEAPELERPVASIGIDGACLFMCEEGHREAMTGAMTLYDAAGERLHASYIAATPE